MQFSILTTIQAPTASVSELVRVGHRFNIPVIAVGDRKSPVCEWPSGSEFLSLQYQKGMDFRLAELLPLDHYSRKNLGYLEAISRGAALLFDTDDDNAPLPHWRPRSARAEAGQVKHNGWVNVYRWFSRGFIWPRGIPLECLQECEKVKVELGPVKVVESPI